MMNPYLGFLGLGDLLGLKETNRQNLGNYKTAYLKYEKKIRKNANLNNAITQLSGIAKEMISKIEYPIEIISSEVIYRPDVKCLAFRITIYFDKEQDWLEYRKSKE